MCVCVWSCWDLTVTNEEKPVDNEDGGSHAESKRTCGCGQQ